MLEAELLSFVRSSIRSTWALEMLILMRGRPDWSFSTAELVRELRATQRLVSACAEQLQAAGLVACEDDGSCRFAPASERLGALCDSLAKLYAEKPFTLLAAIAGSPNERLRDFADAFKITRKED